MGILIAIFNYNFGTTYLGLAPGGYGKDTIVDNLAPYPYNILGMMVIALIAYILVYFTIFLIDRNRKFLTQT